MVLYEPMTSSGIEISVLSLPLLRFNFRVWPLTRQEKSLQLDQPTLLKFSCGLCRRANFWTSWRDIPGQSVRLPSPLLVPIFLQQHHGTRLCVYGMFSVER